MRLPFWLILLLMASCSAPDETPVTPPAETPESTQIAAPDLDVTAEAAADPDRTIDVAVFYRHPLLPGIVPITKTILKTKSEVDQIKQVIDHLTIPPDEALGSPIWPPNTYVREVYTMREERVVVVDFDPRFIESLQVDIVGEEFLLYSLVDAVLTNFTNYERVRILIDGEMRETFLGHIDIEFPLKSRLHPYRVVPEVHVDDEIEVEELEPLDDDRL